MAVFILGSFKGGINQQVDGTKIDPEEYPLLINGRVRDNIIQPIRLPVEIGSTSGVPNGKKQGCYAANYYVIVFNNGKGYIKDFRNSSSLFSLVPSMQMSSNVERIYACLIPSSSKNFTRSYYVDAVTGEKSNIIFGNAVNGSAAAVLVQDGTSRPWVINENGSSRIAKTYNEWTISGREYVPVGLQMAYCGGKLYIVSADSKKIYQSVSGRPLDFMVNINPDGTKLATEDLGGAHTTSFAVSFEDITALFPLNLQDGSFYVGTQSSSFIVRPNTTYPLFGEPTFDNTYLFPIGAINNFSTIDILGDTASITLEGVRSFNAVAQTKALGRNAPFSQKLYKLIHGISQPQTACAGLFDDYALFSVNTTLGPAVLVYDMLYQIFVAIDQYPGVGFIKQFCEVRTNTDRKLLFIDDKDKLYEAFAGEYAQCKASLGEFSTKDPRIPIRPQRIRGIFLGDGTPGDISASVYTDSRISANSPVINTLNGDAVQIVSLDTGRALQGWKVLVELSWNNGAALSHLSLETEEFNGTMSEKQYAINRGK
jgi:hypothetical protein